MSRTGGWLPGLLGLLCGALQLRAVAAEGECSDVHGRVISPGLHYVPGPGTCTLCICDGGQPKWCKAVLCSPPQECKSFRVGNTCCEFICLDETIQHPDDTSDISLRLIVSSCTALVLLCAVVFLVYRIRQRKLMQNNRLTSDDQRSLTSIGYIGGSMGYMSGVCESGHVGFPMWKPPGNYFPRGEAPPPYDEAVAQARAESMRLTADQNASFHREGAVTHTAILENVIRQEEPLRTQPSGHSFTNLPRSMAPVHQVLLNTRSEFQEHKFSQISMNQQGLCYNPPLMQPVTNQPDVRETGHNNIVQPHNSLAHNVSLGFPSGIKLTGSLGTITNRGLLTMIQRNASEPHTALVERERPTNIPGFYTNGNAMGLHSSSLHRTIPRLSTTSDMIDSRDLSFNRASSMGHPKDRLQYLEMRRSFHKPNESRLPLTENGRSIPRDLNLTSNYQGEHCRQVANMGSNHSVLLGASASHIGNLGTIMTHSGNLGPDPGESSRLSAQELTQSLLNDAAKKPSNRTLGKLMGLFNDMLPEGSVKPPESTLPLTVDKPSCVCYTDTPGDDPDADDYHSECENCKSASSSRWVLDEGWEGEEDEGTQTLQRRAPPSAAPPPATATLPQPVTKQRTTPGLSNNWENWFSVIHGSSSSEED